jgi:hypothetical protein
MSAPQCKGLILRTLLQSVRALCGDSVVAKVIDRLPGELGHHLRSGRILAGGWYPVGWYTAMHVAVQEVTSGGPELARVLGRESTRSDFRGPYRFFAIILTPQAMIAKAPKAFRMSWDTGIVRILEARPGAARAEFRGCAEWNALLWQDMLGAVEAVVEIGGGRNPRVELLAGGGDGEDFMDINSRWD